jgi:hypothetical protein
MKTTLCLACVGVAVLGITLWPGTSSPHIAAGDAKGERGVDLPKDDPLLRAIQKRFGKPDRVTGSGRAFIHYDLQNGDTLTLVVSGRKVLGAYQTTPDAPKANDLEDVLFPLPPREVAAGMFEKWQQEAAKKPSSVTYTRVEYDRKTYWVVEASFGYGDPSEKIAVYAPTTGGSFRQCLLAGPIKAGKLAVTADAKTGLLNLSEETYRSIKGELVLSCNLKAIGVLP